MHMIVDHLFHMKFCSVFTPNFKSQSVPHSMCAFKSSHVTSWSRTMVFLLWGSLLCHSEDGTSPADMPGAFLLL